MKIFPHRYSQEEDGLLGEVMEDMFPSPRRTDDRDYGEYWYANVSNRVHSLRIEENAKSLGLALELFVEKGNPIRTYRVHDSEVEKLHRLSGYPILPVSLILEEGYPMDKYKTPKPWFDRAKGNWKSI